MTLTQQELNAVLAHEYGVLDARYNMGYAPRPSGFESIYNKAFFQASPLKANQISCGSYKDKENWGWY